MCIAAGVACDEYADCKDDFDSSAVLTVTPCIYWAAISVNTFSPAHLSSPPFLASERSVGASWYNRFLREIYASFLKVVFEVIMYSENCSDLTAIVESHA